MMARSPSVLCAVIAVGCFALMVPDVQGQTFTWTGESTTDGWFDYYVYDTLTHDHGSYGPHTHQYLVNNWGDRTVDQIPPLRYPDDAMETAVIPAGFAPYLNFATATIYELYVYGSLTGVNPSLSVYGLNVASGAAVSLDGGSLTLRGPGVANEGQISMTRYGTIHVDADVAASGSGTIVLAGATLEGSAGASLTNGPGHTIRGSGIVTTTLVNQGLIVSDADGSSISLRGSVMNEGTIKAAGGQIGIVGQVQQSPAGRILAASNYVWLDNDCVVTGGTIGPGEVVANTVACELRQVTTDGHWTVTLPDTTLQDIRNIGAWDVQGGNLKLTGTGLVNDGTISLGGQLWAPGAASITGTGTIHLAGGTISNSAGTTTLTNEAGHTISGAGDIASGFINRGLVSVNTAGVTMRVLHWGAAAPVVNEGVFEIGAANSLQVDNASMFRQTGGLLIVDGYVNVPDAPLTLAGGSLRGSGAIYGDLASTGANVEPGSAVGDLSIAGNYAQGATGRLSIDLGGPAAGEFDQLQVSGAATLDGELHIRSVNEFVPEVGQEFTILTCAGRTGAFASVTGSGQYEVIYSDNSVTVRVVVPPIPADISGDTSIDVIDLLYLVETFGTILTDPGYNPDCDLNADGSTDVIDLLVLVAWWPA